MLIIELPFPVSTNTYYRHARGRNFISKKGLEFRKAVKTIAVDKAPSGRIEVGVTLYPPDRRVRDIDNYGGKSLLDALVYAGVIEDDSLIDRLVIERGAVTKGGKCRVYINELVDQTE